MFLLVVAVCSFHFQQVSKYEQVMMDNIEKLYKAETLEDYRAVVNTFDRIAQKENDQWEPLYYAAYGHVMMSGIATQTSIKDRHLDQAHEMLKRSYTFAPNEDELWALEGFVHMIRVSIDPADRGQQYSGLSMQSLNKAVKMDPGNPRALYLLGRMELGMAQFFGSDASPACARLQEAVALFERQPAQKSLAPSWGAAQAKEVVRYCNE